MRIPALRVRQWLEAWDGYEFDPASRQRKPEPHFYVCSISARILRRLSGVRERDASGPRVEDVGIQRIHDKSRSEEIGRFVRAGYPWASLNTRDQDRFPTLKKPGWLPTAIVANLVRPTTERDGVTASPTDLITLETADSEAGLYNLVLPTGADQDSWRPTADTLPPLEIIDGQHRLFAFTDDDHESDADFQLPVVIYDDLDISWQAYLFWTINVTPKRINPSMAFDLYPLLRTVDWLEQVEGPLAYRETRAQELTEALWGHPESPWYQRIGMLGRERGKVTQAAFVRSLTLSFVRSWAAGKRTGIGGFFGTEHSNERTDVLQWTRSQQAAYLIALWSGLEAAIESSEQEWVHHLREYTPSDEELSARDPAFAGRYSMLSTDQGVRGFLQVCNDISYHRRNHIAFDGWRLATAAEATDTLEVSAAIQDLAAHADIQDFIRDLTADISQFDWRSAVTPKLPQLIEVFQSRYRSGSGYKQVRLQLLLHLCVNGSDAVAESAIAVAEALGYDQE